MSTITTQRRANVSNKSIVQEIANTISLTNEAVLTTALLRAASEEARNNPAFASKVRAYYEAYLASKPKADELGVKIQFKDILLKPIAKVHGYNPDPGAVKDPYVLYAMFGKEQFILYLRAMSIQELRDSLKVVEAKNPHTAPENRSQRASIIRYIIEHVAQ